ncbi:alpha/beta hydrolase [Agrilutibacter solisilvae]|uniref:Phospholipase n=1 Tax=Agrilutibacter solisilvae TaxID=2763317 RepID=A0A975ATV9_9GAMM|nr:phospholipase [Lysobacter solisilvae]QSX79748.1 phospholipase [Lysobacter solisilvae]
MTAALRTDRELPYRYLGATATPRRLLVLAHGVGGNETNLAGLATRAADDVGVVLVRAPLTLGPGQHAWFPVEFGPQGPRPDLAAAETSRQRLARFVGELQADHGIAPAGTVLAGFSQGGIMSASVALTRPELLAGFGILAGRILPELAPMIAAPDALRGLQGFVGHGRDDTKLTLDWAQRADAWLTQLGITHETRVYPGDHGLPDDMQADFMRWFDGLTRA